MEQAKLKQAFITSDHRIYEEIEFYDEVCQFFLSAKTVRILYDLQSQLEMMTDGRHECPFTRIAEDAKELEDCFKKALKQIKFKPLRRIER